MSAGTYSAGVALSLASTACNALGLTLQKLAHRKVAAAALAPNTATSDMATGSTPRKLHYYTQPLWLLGIFMFVVGSFIGFAAIDILGQSRASAMSSECGRSCLSICGAGWW